MNKPMIVSDEYREGYAAFLAGEFINPYNTAERWEQWADGWAKARNDWLELMGAN